MKSNNGTLHKGSRLIYSGGAKPPDKSRRDFINNPDLDSEITIRAYRSMKNGSMDIPEGYRPITKRV